MVVARVKKLFKLQHYGCAVADTPDLMHDFGFDKGQGLEFGIYTLGDHLPNPNDGSRVSAKERVHEFIRYAQAAEQAGLDYFGLGESHQEFFASQAHAVILGAIAQATSTMRIGSSSTIISTSDPVRVYENFSTLDLLSTGRIELVAGRASRVGLFELLGYDLRDYEELYEEKLELLLQINREESVTWSGQFRAPLNEAEVIPRPIEDRLRIWRAVGGAPGSAIKAGLAGVRWSWHTSVELPPSLLARWMPTARRLHMPGSTPLPCLSPRLVSSTWQRLRKRHCRIPTAT